jgi:hypothetical protein
MSNFSSRRLFRVNSAPIRPANAASQPVLRTQAGRKGKVAWMVPLLLVAAVLFGGGVTFFSAHASSSLSGRYDFRGLTTTGPLAGLYITGGLAITVSATGSISGNICGLKLAPLTCTLVNGSIPDGIHASLTFHDVGHVPDIALTGVYLSTATLHGGFNGFDGAFTIGTSSGKWQAHVGTVLAVTGSWNLYGIVHSGPDVGKQFHGVLSLLESANHRISGTYCPSGGAACNTISGGRDLFGNFFFYVDIGVLHHLIRLRGTFVSGSASRISGVFYSLNTSHVTTDMGYWIGHSV